MLLFRQCNKYYLHYYKVEFTLRTCQNLPAKAVLGQGKVKLLAWLKQHYVIQTKILAEKRLTIGLLWGNVQHEQTPNLLQKKQLTTQPLALILLPWNKKSNPAPHSKPTLSGLLRALSRRRSSGTTWTAASADNWPNCRQRSSKSASTLAFSSGGHTRGRWKIWKSLLALRAWRLWLAELSSIRLPSRFP